MTDSAEQFRERFPILSDTVHLASCSQGAASHDLSNALFDFQRSMRDEGAPWERWMGQVERARQMFARLIGATDAEVAVIPCASNGAFQAASTQDWSQRPRIITTDMEFPSIAHVWLAQQSRGAKVHVVENRDGVVDADDYLAQIDERTKIVSVPLVSYRNGVRLPVKQVIEAAREAGARTFIDAYQATGVQPVDVRELGCDFLVTGSLKYLLGIPGIAFLYVRQEVRDEVEPQLTGWFGRVDPYAFDPHTLDFPAAARRFETGTPSIPAAYGAVAGLTTLDRVDLTVVEEHIRSLVNLLSDRLAEAGERLWSPAQPELRGPQVALVDDDPNALAAWLAARRIVTSPRGHVVRLSFHYYNSGDDIEAFCAALAEYRRRG